MPISYDTAVARMYALGHELATTPAHKFDLAHMRVLLAALGNPESHFPSVLVGGTNGKGSTAATLAAILTASGLRTGLYTSPHLVRINERIQIDGEPISDERFALLEDLVERTAERLVEDGELAWHPSFFEMLTAMAFEHFSTTKLDIAVLEVGMGGRLDATNVVDPRVSVITDISLDHQKFLGNTLAEIAREKAGIIHPGGVLVTLPQSQAANDVIGLAVLEKNATAVNAARYVPPVSPGSPDYVAPAREFASGGGMKPVSRYRLEVLGEEILVESPLIGRHQLRNLALAIAAALELGRQGFKITPESIARGIRQTHWPGRFEVVRASDSAPEWVFDVAHNPAGAWALRATLSAFYPERRLILVFGAMRDKAIAEISEVLFPLADRVILTQADNPRSARPEAIREAASRTRSDIRISCDVPSALGYARETAGPGAVIVVTGSIYVVGEAMRALGVLRDGK